MNLINRNIKATAVALIALAAPAMNASAGDSILQTKLRYGQPRMRFAMKALDNPALRNMVQAPSVSEITVGALSMPASADRIPQLGSGGRDFCAMASSMQRLGKSSVVWGKASYRNGRRYDVMWNETSDFLQLYPYVMADAKGGDTKYEEYRLDGGFSQHHGKAHYGIEVGYRALSEYRDRDPRPNNTVADLFAKLGFGYAVGNGYVMAVGADAGKYKQTNELAFYNELGSQMEYQLTGVGNDFARFSGLCNNCFYKGYDFGAQVNLAHGEGLGWAASLAYSFTQKEKILSDLNRLPLNELKISAVKAAVGYTKQRYGVRASADYSGRSGYDNLFGDASGTVYPQIGTKKQYKGSVAEVRGEGFWSVCGDRRLTVDIEPMVVYRSVRNSHNASGNHIDTDDMLFGAKGTLSHISGKNMFGAKVGVDRRQNLSTDISLSGSANESLATTLHGIADYLKGGETDCTVGAEYSRQVWGNKAVAMALNWRHSVYHGGSSNSYEAKIAFTL